MGTELRLHLAEAADAAALDRVLRAHPRFSDFDPRYGSYNFRLHGAAPAMPHAEARIEARSVYFCDYADDGSIFEALHDALARYGITVETLE